MTVATRIPPLAEQQHIVLDDVSWEFYERVLEEIGDRPIRVTFDEGSIEIMPPLQEHELPSRAIASLLSIMAVELDIPMSAYGSSTFRAEEKQKGLEPDECFYLANERRVRGMKGFDPAVGRHRIWRSRWTSRVVRSHASRSTPHSACRSCGVTMACAFRS